jgi:hypothetical protein
MYLRVFHQVSSQRISRSTCVGLAPLELILALSTSISDLQEQKLEEPLEARRKLEVVVSQALMPGNSICAEALARQIIQMTFL